MKITDYPLVVVVWAQRGCPACHEYMPRFRRIAQKYGCVPTMTVYAEDFGRAADHYRIMATPVTTVLRYGRRTFVGLDGAAPDAQIDALFQSVIGGPTCP